MACVTSRDAVSSFGVRSSVLLYVQSEDSAGTRPGRYGGACVWRNSDAPDCAARFEMWTCTAGNRDESGFDSKGHIKRTVVVSRIHIVEARQGLPARIVVDRDSGEECTRKAVSSDKTAHRYAC